MKGHKAADCPSKGKCFVCKKEGHLSRDCTRRVNVPVTEAAPQSPPCGQAPEGVGSGCSAEDLRDNELDPDSEGQTYFSDKYDDNSLAVSCDNANNLVEPALNVNADSVNASNNINSVNNNVNAVVQNPKGDCAANNVNAAGNLISTCSSVTPASKASYSSVVATGEAAAALSHLARTCLQMSPRRFRTWFVILLPGNGPLPRFRRMRPPPPIRMLR